MICNVFLTYNSSFERGEAGESEYGKKKVKGGVNGMLQVVENFNVFAKF
jgi:hypothetical protein